MRENFQKKKFSKKKKNRKYYFFLAKPSAQNVSAEIGGEIRFPQKINWEIFLPVLNIHINVLTNAPMNQWKIFSNCERFQHLTHSF